MRKVSGQSISLAITARSAFSLAILHATVYNRCCRPSCSNWESFLFTQLLIKINIKDNLNCNHYEIF